jgi:hypothetical protein
VPEGKDPHDYGVELMQKYHVKTTIEQPPGHEKSPNPLTNCSTCHY